MSNFDDSAPRKTRNSLSDDLGAVIGASKQLDVALGEDFMIALDNLHYAYGLPEAVHKLRRNLRHWWEEVHILFPNSGETPPQPQPRPDDAPETEVQADYPVHSRQVIRRTRRHLGLRFASVSGKLVGKRTWATFSKACSALTESVLEFYRSMIYLSHSEESWCKVAIGELMVTLTELGLALQMSLEEHGADKPDAKIESDLRDFVIVRLNVCQLQLSNVKDAIVEYRRSDLNRVRKRQKQDFEGLSTAAQIATFFAVVVASTLPISLNAERTASFIIINSLWLLSLVFCIGSALNSFLGMHVKKAILSTPLAKQPSFVKFWMRESYVGLLVISIIAYAVGLGVYVVKSQNVVVAIITCTGAGFCAIGVAIISGARFRDTWLNWLEERSARLVGTNKNPTHDDDDSPPEYSSVSESAYPERVIVDDAEHQATLQAQKPIFLDDPEIHNAAGQNPPQVVVGGDTKVCEAVEPLANPDHDGDADIISIPIGSGDAGVDSSAQDRTKQQTKIVAYVDRLKHIQQLENKKAPENASLGPITHMRCSPNGRWVVVCQKYACIVYDLESKGDSWHVTLLADDDKRSAEHAEWALQGPRLLTRTEKELRLWRIPTSDREYPKTGKNLSFKARYIFRDRNTKGLFKYIKWLDETDFLVLTDKGVIYRVDSELGTKQVVSISQEEVAGYHFTQVYPIVSNSIDSVICLATNLPRHGDPENKDINDVFGDGVDYFFHFSGIRRTQPRTIPELLEFFMKLLNLNTSTADSAPEVAHSLKEADSESNAVLEHEYSRKLQTVLYRNIRNMKFCQQHRFMLINYAENELGTTAPELWSLNTGDPRSEHFRPYGYIAELPTPKKPENEKRISGRWGEASFAGQNHDVIVCEVFGIIRFYHFNREGPSTLREIEMTDMKMPDFKFEEFDHPIFTWGDTMPRPLLVATDSTGSRNIKVWAAPLDGDVDMPHFEGEGLGPTASSTTHSEGGPEVMDHRNGMDPVILQSGRTGGNK